MPEVRFHLSLSKEQVEAYYAGQVHQVVTTTVDGRSVRFPIRVLHRFIGRDGIQGHFVLHYTDAGKFDRIERLGP